MEVVETSTSAEPTPPPADAPTSIADHAAQFGPVATREEPTIIEPSPVTSQPPRERHRASSQRASVEDVAQINALTKDLRTKEQELAKLRPEALEGSPRLLALRRQIKAIETELAEHAPKPQPPQIPPVPAAKTTAPATATFDEPEPTLDDFASADDPWTSWQRALGRWDRKKEAFEEQQAQRATQAQAETTARQQHIQSAYNARLTEFIKATPDFAEKFQAVAADVKEVPALLMQALFEDDNGPAHLYHLLTHPSDFDDMRLLTDGKPVTEHSVALLRRRLSSLSRSQAVATGSAVATVPPSLAPRPPNPVRTGPMKTGDEPPGGDLSIAEHAKYYGPKRR